MAKKTTRRERVNRDRGEMARKVLRKLGYITDEELKLGESEFIEIAAGLVTDLLHLAENSEIQVLYSRGDLPLVNNIAAQALQNYTDDTRGS